MLTENQISDQLDALAEERRGYELRRAAVDEHKPMRVGDTAEKIDARLAAADDRAAWLRGQSNDERTRSGGETRLRGDGAQTRAAGDVDLDALNVKQLKALADDVGVDRAGLSKKADLIAALTADGARIREGTGEPMEGVELQVGETGVISGDDEF